jgi:class 3 adenylate cyclase
MDSRVLSIMFTDIKGFTERSGTSSRKGVLDLLKKHDNLLKPVIQHFEGKIIKTIGDAFLVVYESPTNAVLAGLVMQYRLKDHNAHANEEDRIEVRISINTGEVQLTDGDVFGDAVNIASRINGITEPNEIYFTEAVYLSMNKQEVPSSEIGLRRLKGISEDIKVYKVIQDPNTEQYRKALSEFKSRSDANMLVPPPAATPASPQSRPYTEPRKPLPWKKILSGR